MYYGTYILYPSNRPARDAGGKVKMKLTNQQIAAAKHLWDEYYNTSALPENDFSATTYEERLEMLERDYPDEV